MRKYTVITPENISVDYTLADLGSRGAAAVIDLTIQLAFLLVITFGTGFLAAFAPDYWEAHYGWIIGIGLVVWFVFSIGYYIGCEVAFNGRTIGKRIMKIRVIRMNGQPVALSHVAIRNLFKLIIDLQGIGVVMIFFSKHCRRLGDIVASTLVVTETQLSAPMSLAALTGGLDRVSHYLSREEQEILRAWLERKETLDRPEELHQALISHLEARFTEIGLIGEFREFIEKI